MPKDLKWKIVLIVAALLFAGVAVYPTEDTLMWYGKVKDTINNRGIVEKRLIREKTIENKFAYWADKLTLGIFHHKKESYRDEKALQTFKDYKIVERAVFVDAAGLTLGLDLEGGAELRYLIQEHAASGEDAAAKVIEIIRKRIDAMGLKEPIIQREGPKRIQIQLPGKDKQEVQRIKNIIESTGHLEFRLVCSNTELIQQAEAGDVPEGYRWYTERDNPEEKLLVKDNAELTGEYITDTDVRPNPQTRQLQVALDFNGEGRRLFAKATGENVGERLAIILDDVRGANGEIIRQGKLYSAPTIEGPIWGSAVIKGMFTRREAEDLRTTLQAGSLPATLELEDESLVGPSLGRDSIQAGKAAIVIGFVAVILFMVIYYHKAGIVADIALLLNLVLIVGALAVFQATLTLPGIAGIILTVGMSVDANVLIFERIREEMQKKGAANLMMAVRDGYSRAFVTIVDANLTTLGTALTLYMLGTGAVKGFAATLSMGIVFSMFTAIFVTRVIFEFFITKGWIHKLGMFRIIGQPSIPFYQKARYAALGSVALIAIGLVIFGTNDENFDIDFRGGTMLHVVTQGKVSDSEIRDLLADGYQNANVQSISGRKNFSEFEIKTSTRGESQIMSAEIISALSQGKKAEFAGGYELKVKIDKPAEAEEVDKLLTEKAGADVHVEGAGAKMDGGFKEFVVLVKIDEKNKAQAAVKNAFAELSVKAEIGKLLAAKLAPPAFPIIERTPNGEVKLEVNFEKPVEVADLVKNLGVWGYENPSVSVKGAPGAAEGTTMEIVAKAKPDDPEFLRTSIEGEYQVTEPFARVRSVGAHVAGVMKERAAIAILLSLVFVVGYIWFRFEFNFGIAAVVALIHDVAFTVGILAVARVPFNLTIIAAILTIIGYSLNDTIVVFDRIRENLALLRRERYENIVNISVNQTLSRTLLTSITTLVAVLALLLFGGGVIRNFAFALMVGVLVGTYSSIFIASPFVVMMHKRAEKRRHATSAAAAHSRG